MYRRPFAIAAALAATLALPILAQDKPRYAGPTDRGFLLPNGWTLTPAGDQVTLSDLPLNIIPLADSRHALVGTGGYNAHELSVVDLDSKTVVAKAGVRESWFGLALDEKAGKVWWSGGGNGIFHTFTLKGNSLERAGKPEPEPASARKKAAAAAKSAAPDGFQGPPDFKSGVALGRDGSTLYTLDMDAGTLTVADLKGGGPDRSAKVAARPYDVAIARNGSRIYVSDWVGRAVVAIDPTDLRVVARIGVGEHPNQIALHPADDRLFVACASSNSVAVIDTGRGVVTETIATSLFPLAPEGSTQGQRTLNCLGFQAETDALTASEAHFGQPDLPQSISFQTV